MGLAGFIVCKQAGTPPVTLSKYSIYTMGVHVQAYQSVFPQQRPPQLVGGDIKLAESCGKAKEQREPAGCVFIFFVNLQWHRCAGRVSVCTYVRACV